MNGSRAVTRSLSKRSLVDAEPVQGTVVALGFQECERDVLGPDVVVTEAKRLPEGQFERFLARSVERDERRHLAVGARRAG